MPKCREYSPELNGKLSHIDAHGNVSMVDVSDKPDTRREAVAEAFVTMAPETLRLIETGGHKKGDVLTVARIAGIQAAKRCSTLIPLCHPLQLTGIELDVTPQSKQNRVRIVCRCRLTASTGVEMEALTAAAVAALTIYDMCKAADRGMVIEGVRLLQKTGGRSGIWQAEEEI